MLEEYKTVYEGGEAEIVEKKSRFIAEVKPIEREEDALEFIESVRKKHWNARHHCFAYTAGTAREILRCSDDGEPSGTAGKPMLDVLMGEELYNTAVVVTRYFGGTLLGTGGLVRAYSKAVQEGLVHSRVIKRQRGCLLEMKTDYNGLGKLQYLCGQNHIPIIESEYTDMVTLQVLVSAKEKGKIEKAVTEATNGKALVTVIKELYFACLDGTYLQFEENG